MQRREELFPHWLGMASLMMSFLAFRCGGSPVETSIDRAGVRISGQLSQLAGSCPHIGFKLGSKRIATNDSRAFDDRLCPDLRNGEGIEVEGNWDPDGSLAARAVKRQEEPPRFEIRGAISDLSGSCPNLAFSVGTERLTTDSSTRFKDQPCSSLRNGQSVEVHGTHRRDGSAFARQVEPNREAERIEVLGTVRNPAGSCPDLTFSVGGDVIVTGASTRFRSSCSALSAGQFVEVEGARQDDGRIFAADVEVEDELEQQEVELRGPLGAMGGTCPEVSFTVQGRAVRANGHTVFERLSCSALRDGVPVEVKGAIQPDGSVLASRVKAER